MDLASGREMPIRFAGPESQGIVDIVRVAGE